MKAKYVSFNKPIFTPKENWERWHTGGMMRDALCSECIEDCFGYNCPEQIKLTDFIENTLFPED